MGKLSPNVTAALIIGACIIIAAWIHKPIARYKHYDNNSRFGVTFDTKTGARSFQQSDGPIPEIEDNFRTFKGP